MSPMIGHGAGDRAQEALGRAPAPPQPRQGTPMPDIIPDGSIRAAVELLTRIGRKPNVEPELKLMAGVLLAKFSEMQEEGYAAMMWARDGRQGPGDFAHTFDGLLSNYRRQQDEVRELRAQIAEMEKQAKLSVTIPRVVATAHAGFLRDMANAGDVCKEGSKLHALLTEVSETLTEALKDSR